MNSQTVYHSAVLSAFMFGATACVGQSNVVYYGANSNSLDVVFVDTNLSMSVKSNIVADLRICLQELGKTAEVCLGDDEDTAGYLDINAINPYYPEDIDFPRNIVSNGASGVALQIPKELSDAYTNAFAFAAANSNVVAAANEFVKFISSTNFLHIPPNTLPDYILEQKWTTEEVIARAPKEIPKVCSLRYAPPSLLGFRYYEHGPAASNLWVFIPSALPPSDDGEQKWDCFPAIWHEGKWKLSFWGWFDY